MMWRFIREKLEAGMPVMLLAVVDRRGSSPGKQGFKMAVSSDGGLAGSVGGGVMEYQMVELARKMLAEGSRQPVLKRQVHDPAAPEDKSGLICSGEQTHAFIPLERKDVETVGQLCESAEGVRAGWIELGPGGLSCRPDGDDGIVWEKTSDNAWKYLEPAGKTPKLYIFGGGHLSVPVSQVSVMLGFRVIVLDDREGLNTMESNIFAHEKRLVNYKQAGSEFKGDEETYVVIMTVSHATDQLILSQMLDKPLKYLGMIGSRKKVQKIFESLRLGGATDEQLSRVDSPMGLPLGGHTPAEIAVSIAARIIQVKNTQTRVRN